MQLCIIIVSKLKFEFGNNTFTSLHSSACRRLA